MPLFFVLFSLTSIAQNAHISDSTLNEVCKTLVTKENKLLPDSDRVRQVIAKHLSPILLTLNESEQTAAITYTFYRLQRNCKEFKSILDQATPNKGDWVSLNKKPKSTLTKKDFDKFLKIGNYSYLEHSGDTVHISLTTTTWEDHFKDGTYSMLTLHWIKNAEFQIEFMESNNEIRKNFSKPGDKYRYQLLEKHSDYYLMSLEIPGKSQFMTFKLYY